MAKQKPVKPITQSKKPAASSAGNSAFTYFWRNAVVIAGLGIIALIFWNKFSDERKLSDLTQRFYTLRASNPRSPELRDVYDQIMVLQPEVSSDTSLLTRVTRGYHWAIHDMCMGSVADIAEREEQLHRMQADSTPQALLEAKKTMKVGVYTLLKYVNENTPKDAVITLPPPDSLANEGKWNFIYDPEWVEYFLYPRLCVASHDTTSPLKKKASYALIVNGFGYENLKYNVPLNQRPKEAVLPIDHPPVQPQTQN